MALKTAARGSGTDNLAEFLADFEFACTHASGTWYGEKDFTIHNFLDKYQEIHEKAVNSQSKRQQTNVPNVPSFASEADYLRWYEQRQQDTYKLYEECQNGRKHA
jgi:hypothetical protein